MDVDQTRNGFRFTAAESAALARLHEVGLRSRRYDTMPDRLMDMKLECPCELTGRECPEAGNPFDRHCAEGQSTLAGQDHPDRWYRRGRLVAVVHYPYGIDHDELLKATAGCERLGLRLDVDSRWAIHACDQWTLAVVISAEGIRQVVRGR